MTAPLCPPGGRAMRMLIQILLIVGVLFVVARLFRSRGARAQAIRRVGLMLFAAFAVVSILFPTVWNGIANVLGVGRGTDMVLYALVVAFLKLDGDDVSTVPRRPEALHPAGQEARAAQDSDPGGPAGRHPRPPPSERDRRLSGAAARPKRAPQTSTGTRTWRREAHREVGTGHRPARPHLLRRLDDLLRGGAGGLVPGPSQPSSPPSPSG